MRLELSNVAEFVGGGYTAAHLETVNLFQNIDGTLEWELKALETTPEGDNVIISGKGTGKTTGPTTLRAEGDFVYMTRSPKLSWLNETKGRLEVIANMATGEFENKVYVR